METIITPSPLSCTSGIELSFNVGCGIDKDQLLGPRFFDQTLASSFYETQIFRGLVKGFTFSTQVTLLQEMRFQHVGAQTHTSRLATASLDRNFSSCWIGREGPAPWTARPPDLNSLVFLWRGLIKNKNVLNGTKEQDLQGDILLACRAIESCMIKRVVASTNDRLLLCIPAGQHRKDAI